MEVAQVETSEHIAFPKQWQIGLFEVGETRSCLYSWCCCCCAIGSARNQLDGSDWYVNCCEVQAAAARWSIRTAYNIEGTAQYDCWIGGFCCCCAANQMLQTVKEYGRISDVPNVGPFSNMNQRTGFSKRQSSGIIYDCVYAFFCLSCANAYNLQSAGMPWWFAFCCTNGFSGNNLLRYTHRTKPCCNNEFLVDCCIPCCLSFIPEIGVYTRFLAEFVYTYGNLVEENVRADRPNCCYGCDCWNFCIAFPVKYCINNCSCPSPEPGRYLHPPVMANTNVVQTHVVKETTHKE